MEVGLLKEMWGTATKKFGINTKVKTNESVFFRAAFCKTFYEPQNVSLSTIGGIIGKDHSTVLFALRRVDSGYYKNCLKFKYYTNYFEGVKTAIKDGGNVKTETIEERVEVATLLQRIAELEEKEKHSGEVLLTLIELENKIKQTNNVLRMSGVPVIDLAIIDKLKALI